MTDALAFAVLTACAFGGWRDVGAWVQGTIVGRSHLPDVLKDGQPQVLLARLLGVRAADDVSAVGNGLLRVKRALLSSEALRNERWGVSGLGGVGAVITVLLGYFAERLTHLDNEPRRLIHPNGRFASRRRRRKVAAGDRGNRSRYSHARFMIPLLHRRPAPHREIARRDDRILAGRGNKVGVGEALGPPEMGAPDCVESVSKLAARTSPRGRCGFPESLGGRNPKRGFLALRGVWRVSANGG